MIKLILVLFKIRFFRIKNMIYLFSEISKFGVNIGFLSSLLARIHQNKTAIIFNNKSISYLDVANRSKILAHYLKSDFNLVEQQKIAIISRNHPNLIYSIFGSGFLGLDIYLLPCDIKQNQFEKLNEIHQFDFVIYDDFISELIYKIGYESKSFSISKIDFLINDIDSIKVSNLKFNRNYTGRIVVLTAGTTGVSKIASRKTNPFAFVIPFYELIHRLHLTKYKSVYVAIPLYHGFGISAFFVSYILGQKVFIDEKFDAKKVCLKIKENQIETICLVPTILQRLLNSDDSSLNNLKCIVSGGSALNKETVLRTQNELGNILFNLYGTSEAGFCFIANPNDLKQFPETIGKPISRVNLKFNRIENSDGLNELQIKCDWSICSNEWIRTGDLIYKNDFGFYFLKGRVDEMIISGGENVYPIEIENCILEHPLVSEVVVIGISDLEFGQRLIAFVYASENMKESQLRNWLSERLQRFQMPKSIYFVSEIPKNEIGKIKKNTLLEML